MSMIMQGKHSMSRMSGELGRMLGLIAVAAALFIGLSGVSAQASGPGHYAPAIPNILDFFVPPDPGVYYLQYTPYYNSDTLHDTGGNSVNTVLVKPGPGPGVPVNISVDVHAITLAPALAWVTPWKILGARYGAYLMPTLSNTNLSAELQTALGSGVSADEANYAWGDMYFQPIWLGWSLKHWDIELGEGFYAPVGKYSTSDVIVGPYTVTVPSASNVGLGYWTNQLQAGTAWYPFDNKATAVAGAVTYIINGKQHDIDNIPGQRVVLNWGINQYLPLTKDQTRLVSVGLTGYSNWQVSSDHGSDSGSTKSQLHAVGGQVGYTIVPSNFALNVRYLHEFDVRGTFIGDWVGLSFAVKAF